MSRAGERSGADSPVVDRDGVREILGDLSSKFIGQPAAKAQVSALVDQALLDEVRREEGLPVEGRNYNLVFSGSPGTGKTTMANTIARIYQRLGIVPTDKVVVRTGTKMISEFKNDTPRLVKEAWDEAKGGVLFIDEAYGMDMENRDNEAAQQALDTLAGLINDPKPGEPSTVVIMAGYSDRIGRMLARNEGLPRRFPTTIDFENFRLDERMQILESNMASRDLSFARGSAARDAAMDALLDTGDGNAGDVRNLLMKIEQARDARIVPMFEQGKVSPARRRALLTTVTAADVRAGRDAFVRESMVDNPLRGKKGLVAVPTGRKRAVGPAAKKAAAKKAAAKKPAAKKPAAKRPAA